MTAFLATIWHFEAWRFVVVVALLIAGSVWFGWLCGSHKRQRLERALEARNEALVRLRGGVDHGD